MVAPDKVAGFLTPGEEKTVSVATPHRSWLVRMAAGTLRVDAPGVTPPSALVEGSAPDVLLWLWNRDRQQVSTSGERAAITLLRTVVDAVLGNRVTD
jgi:hypothetical protein